ncbi:tRNA (5-methylaminomethyl-2-thiouridine)(34)-methyltransferase MnmD [Lacinutrix salivirga]
MKRKIITTADGSKTIQIEEWDEQYHSIHGAIQEAQHVFIKKGLEYVINSKPFFNTTNPLSILEIGFGTGLNAFITCIKAEEFQIPIHYTGIEAYPVVLLEIEQLNYSEQLKASIKEDLFNIIHNTSWENSNHISKWFQLKKEEKLFSELTDKETYNLIYFDAFGPRVQPELWTEAIFKLMYNALKTNGVLVTYSAKGSVRRAMQAVGFTVERTDGPPGKREMLRAVKC